MKKMVAERGMTDRFLIASAATSTEEIPNGRGNPVYPPARAELARHGIACSGKHAVLLNKEDARQYDYLIVMDERNLRNTLRIIGEDGKEKVHKLLDFTCQKGDIADPWYTGDFAAAYHEIEEGCAALLQNLCEK